MRELRHSPSQPNSLRRDNIHVQHADDSSKIKGIWFGNKSDKRKCIINKGVVFLADEEDYPMVAEDKYVGADTTTSAVTVTLPDVADIEDGHEVIIDDEGGNAGANNITIATNGDETVETAAITANDGMVRLMWDVAGDNWKDVS